MLGKIVRTASAADTAASVLTGGLTRAAGENVGTYGIGQGTLASNANYVIAFNGANLSITPATLTVSLTGTVTKTYDGTTSATLSGANYVLTGFVAGDTQTSAGVTLLQDGVQTATTPTVGSFDTKDAGTSKFVTVSDLSLGGNVLGNYTLGGVTSTSAPIGTTHVLDRCGTKDFDSFPCRHQQLLLRGKSKLDCSS